MSLKFPLFSFFLLLFFQLTTLAQTNFTPQWLVQPSLPFSSGPETVSDAVITTNDDTYVIGSFRNGADFDPGRDTFYLKAPAGYSLFLAKYDANGNYLFSRIFKMNGEFESIQSDKNRNIYLSGEFAGRVSFNPVDTSDVLVANGGADMVIAKYDSAGNYIYANHVGPAGEFNSIYPYDIKLSSSGRIVVCGTLQGKADFDPGPKTFNLAARTGGATYFAAAYTSGGDFLFATAADSTSKGNSFACHLFMDGDDIIISRRYNGTVDLDPGSKVYTPPSIGSGDAFFIKYNSTGKVQFVHAFVATSISDNITTINSIAADTLHNIYIAGGYHNKTDLDFGTNNVFLDKNGSYMAIYDSSGNYRPVYGFTPFYPYGRDGSPANGLWINKQNEVIPAGTSTGSLDLDPGQDSLLFHSPVYLHSLFYLVKYKQVINSSDSKILIPLTEQLPAGSAGKELLNYLQLPSL